MLGAQLKTLRVPRSITDYSQDVETFGVFNSLLSMRYWEVPSMELGGSLGCMSIKQGSESFDSDSP